MSSISSSRSVGRVGAVGASGGGATSVGATMGAIAADVAGTITSELKLAVDPDRPRKQGRATDLYEIEDAADTLSATLGGTVADRGRLSQSLHRFAQEVAAQLAACPDSAAMMRVAAVIGAAQSDGAAATIPTALATIDKATAAIAAPQG